MWTGKPSSQFYFQSSSGAGANIKGHGSLGHAIHLPVVIHRPVHVCVIGCVEDCFGGCYWLTAAQFKKWIWKPILHLNSKRNKFPKNLFGTTYKWTINFVVQFKVVTTYFNIQYLNVIKKYKQLTYLKPWSHNIAPSWIGIAEKWSWTAAAELAGNLFSCGHIPGCSRAVTPCFLSQPGTNVSCCDLEMT